MPLTHEDRKTIERSNEIEKTLGSKGWKIIDDIIVNMCLGALGGVDKDGILINGQVSNPDPKYSKDFYIGYGQALIELRYAAVHQPRQARKDIHDRIKEEKSSKDRINPLVKDAL